MSTFNCMHTVTVRHSPAVIVSFNTSLLQMFVALGKGQVWEDLMSQTGPMWTHEKPPCENTLSTASDVAGTHSIFPRNLWSFENHLSSLNKGHGFDELRACAVSDCKLSIYNMTTAATRSSHETLVSRSQHCLFVTQSLQDDGDWCFACYVSLLNPQKFSRTWTSEDEDKYKD